jgi:hypothetical protein
LTSILIKTRGDNYPDTGGNQAPEGPV